MLKCRKIIAYMQENYCLNAGVTVYSGSKDRESEILTIVDAISDQKGTTIATSCKKLELILVFSIVDAISDQKGTTITTSHNDCKEKVRQGGKKSGKISGKSQEGQNNNLENQLDKSFEFLHHIQEKRAKRPKFNKKLMTKKTSINNRKNTQ